MVTCGQKTTAPWPSPPLGSGCSTSPTFSVSQGHTKGIYNRIYIYIGSHWSGMIILVLIGWVCSARTSLWTQLHPKRTEWSSKIPNPQNLERAIPTQEITNLERAIPTQEIRCSGFTVSPTGVSQKRSCKKSVETKTCESLRHIAAPICPSCTRTHRP